MTVLTKLQCQNCSAALERSDDYQKTIKCKYCGSSFEVSKSDDNESTEVLVSQTSLKPVKPDDIDIDKTASQLRFTRHWRKRGSFILLAMACLWLVIIVNQIAQTWLEGANASILFLLLFVLVGGLLLFRALSEIFNHSTLSVSKQAVSLETKPFVWKGDFSKSMDEIKFFEIVPPPGPGISPSTRLYRLCAITRDDMRLTLWHKIKNPGHAIYLLRQVNEFTNKP